MSEKHSKDLYHLAQVNYEKQGKNCRKVNFGWSMTTCTRSAGQELEPPSWPVIPCAERSFHKVSCHEYISCFIYEKRETNWNGDQNLKPMTPNQLHLKWSACSKPLNDMWRFLKKICFYVNYAASVDCNIANGLDCLWALQDEEIGNN